MVKKPPANAGDIRNEGSIPGSGKFPRGGHGNQLQYSCLENPMNREVWQAMVHRVAKSRIKLKPLSMHINVSSNHCKVFDLLLVLFCPGYS